MADLITEAVQLLQQVQQYINTTEQPVIEDRWRTRWRERVAKRSHYKPKQAAPKPKRTHKSPYEVGMKYCGKCGEFKQVKGSWCLECGRPLRVKPKAASIKRRLKRHAKKK